MKICAWVEASDRFGGKLHTHPDVVLAVLAALAVPGRPVKLALTRQQMFSQVGYRTPSVQRVRLGAGPDGTGGDEGPARDSADEIVPIVAVKEMRGKKAARAAPILAFCAIS